ncbi:MAG: SDR family oxidoreductase [Rhodocyclaceae bacterium]|jgi:NAD(P)-dependent dehydrogenase (short-subunit alcohol dehydrogenase family)|nr:SDR family oxidoreductase [Rhodocyclaceae bacterium]
MRTIHDLVSLQGRSALVTGGAGHIGMAAAEALFEAGARVALLDSNAAAAARCAEGFNVRWPGMALPIACDLSDEAATREAARQAIAALGGLDILVHSAAFVGTTKTPGWSAPFAEQTVAAWDAGMRVNLTSAFILTQEARQALAASGRGSVIFVSSIYGLVGSDAAVYEGTGMNADRVLAYSASKGGLLQLMRHFSTLLAPAVRVNAISPGGIERGQPEAFRRNYAARTPLKRMGTEEDMKGAVAYLASDLSAYVTGQNLVVDGGWTAW